MTDPLLLAGRIAERTSAVPDVTDLYPTSPFATRRKAAAAGDHRPLVRVRDVDGVVEVLISVGVAERAAAPAVGAAVHTVIDQELDAAGVGARRVTVRVATIG